MRKRYAIGLVVTMLCCVKIYSQSEMEIPFVKATELTPSKKASLVKVFKKHKSVRLNARELHGKVTAPGFNKKLELALGDNTMRFEIYPHDIRHPDYQLILRDGKKEKKVRPGQSYTYRGWNLDYPSQEIRLTITPDYVTGFVGDALGKRWFIQPAKDFDPEAGSETVLYQAEDVIDDEERTCASTHVHEMGSPSSGNSNARSFSCKEVEVAIAADYSMYTKYNNNASALAQHLLDIKNLQEPNYGVFNVEFTVVKTYIVTSSGNDPWTSSTDANTLLNSFCCWAGTGSSSQLNCTGQNGFAVTHDVGELWTNRDFDGSTVGLAWVGTICNNMFGYSVDQHFTTNLQSLRVLIAHEQGHNFGASHDASGDPHIMAPSVNSSNTTFSSASQSAINNNLPGYTCLSACTPDCSDPAVDMDITSLSLGACNAGPPSTYDLTLVITHGGGNGQGFNVTVDGTNYFKSFGSSPQTVVVSNLPADGQSDVPVIVKAVSNNESGCQAGTSYNAPSPCGGEIAENFNSCNLPGGWTITTTNPYTFQNENGEDPEVQYRWKFDNDNRPLINYDYSSPPYTINGSCMAYFDDDINSSSQFSGINTLTSSVYDLTQFENVVLSFDYNFHNFEDGKPANGSFFKVEVRTVAGNWVQILYDDDDTCPWTDAWASNCSTHFSANIDQYAHNAFQVRFIYSDGDNGAWTGMIAMDNFAINGDEAYSGPCEQTVTVLPGQANGHKRASQMIMTNGNVSASNGTIFNAPTVVLDDQFTVPAGATFEARTAGCQ